MTDLCSGMFAIVAIVVLLACAGTAAGATWVVDDDGEAEQLNTYDKINHR